MASARTYDLSLELNENRLQFFPEAVGKENADFRAAVTKRVRTAFTQLNGVLQSVTVSDTLIKLTWQADQKRAGYLDQIAATLTKGNYADGILLLELFLSGDPDNPDLLYNLGMAYSDQNQLNQAIALLQRLVAIEPGHVNGRVALGVALLRNKNDDQGIEELETAIKHDPRNLWAHRNLGAGLMRLKRHAQAEEHLRLATEIDPNDQASMYGYGQALDAGEKFEQADAAYEKTVALDEFSNLAELARKARSKFAHKNFLARTPGTPRMDAVMYCLGALERFAELPPDQVRKIGFEIAILGTRGLEVNDSSVTYTLHSLPGVFSGLHLLSIQYVAFKQFAPTQDIGFDLSAEYEAAWKLFGEKGK